MRQRGWLVIRRVQRGSVCLLLLNRCCSRCCCQVHDSCLQACLKLVQVVAVRELEAAVVVVAV
jgi:hypothetical protein